MAVIKRFIADEKSFEDIVEDFGFLVEKIKNSGFEYDLQIRDGYFNLYYKGNSIGKISYKKDNGKYEVRIHEKFVPGRVIERFKSVLKNRYQIFSIPRKQLHSLFSSQNLKLMSSMVKKISFQEEVIYEQMLMTDNVNRDDLIIIDRQVSDKASGTKMDLLTLKKNKGGCYQFCVFEVKLGNNPELEGDVTYQGRLIKRGVNTQLKEYTQRIENNFDDYRTCYQKNLEQKERLGLITRRAPVDIVHGVLGVVVVMGYSGMAERKIEELRRKDPSIRVIQLSNRIDVKNLE
ncbi:hypothetical protein D1BOALGB6SA_6942 [Olavius sp. associated proteobacterium Delta 1]|nr:hypothetical protein D1BOALGB6SA_6942 [Olavius sp. associated proteobacterium Delta 1]